MAVRFTLRAGSALIDIADWTYSRFGPEQADAYRLELIAVCQSLLSVSPLERSVKDLIGSGSNEIRYRRASMHFIIFRRTGSAVDILDFLHVRSDLAARLRALDSKD
ncbi:MAG: type II toxin-antitoxin system RelE/ParE family toxin [Caulobacterales bacterium]|uniref:type II toxin-antitoxin system RelE/ParE family toxin n=1 Tax=Glycocaulis sp. TaxID=1969725 RepID=UPI003F9FE921